VKKNWSSNSARKSRIIIGCVVSALLSRTALHLKPVFCIVADIEHGLDKTIRDMVSAYKILVRKPKRKAPVQRCVAHG
jgi:hypothetical protein